MRKHEPPGDVRPVSVYVVSFGGLTAGCAAAIGACAAGTAGLVIGLLVGLIAMFLLIGASYSKARRR